MATPFPVFVPTIAERATSASVRPWLRLWHWLLTPGWFGHTPAAKLRGWARVLDWREAANRAGRARLVMRAIKLPARAVRDAYVHVARSGAEVEAVSGVSRATQRRHLTMLALRYGMSSKSYRDFQLYRPDRYRDAARYMQDRESTRVVRWVNRRQIAMYGDSDAPALDRKSDFPAWCAARGLPTVQVLLECDNGILDVATLPGGAEGDAAAALPECDLFTKPDRGSQGSAGNRWYHEIADNGASRWRDREGRLYTATELLAAFLEMSRAQPVLGSGRKSSRMILQPALSNHRGLAPLTSGALCTARVLVCRASGHPSQVVRASYRMPIGGSPIDNFSAGGIAASIDLATGQLGPAVRRSGPVVVAMERHPDTGAMFLGLQLPCWPETLALATRALDAARRVPMVGWDIAITDKGPVLIEGNLASDPDIAQAPLGRPLSDTVLPDIIDGYVRRLIGE